MKRRRHYSQSGRTALIWIAIVVVTFFSGLGYLVYSASQITEEQRAQNAFAIEMQAAAAERRERAPLYPHGNSGYRYQPWVRELPNNGAPL